MNPDGIALACPHCRHTVTQLAPGARPIQDQRVNCTSCKRASKLAKLTTSDGNTFQMYMREVAANVTSANRVTTTNPAGKSAWSGSM